MKYVSPELKALIDSGRYICAELYTLTLLGGSIYRLTSAPDFDAEWAGHTYIYDSFGVERGTIKQAVGIEVDNVDVTLTAKIADTIASLLIPSFVRNGGFDGARMLIQRGYFALDNSGNVNTTATGVIYGFEGRVAEPKPSRTQVAFKLVADTERLNKMVPINTVTPSCLNIFGDANCGKNKADFSHTGSVTEATKMSVSCGLSQPDNYYRLGTLQFTSGQNAGAMRSVKSYSTGHFELANGFNYVPAVGDTFVATAGCDLSEATCDTTFNNLASRRALKWVPLIEDNL